VENPTSAAYFSIIVLPRTFANTYHGATTMPCLGGQSIVISSKPLPTSSTTMGASAVSRQFVGDNFGIVRKRNIQSIDDYESCHRHGNTTVRYQYGILLYGAVSTSWNSRKLWFAKHVQLMVKLSKRLIVHPMHIRMRGSHAYNISPVFCILLTHGSLRSYM